MKACSLFFLFLCSLLFMSDHCWGAYVVYYLKATLTFDMFFAPPHSQKMFIALFFALRPPWFQAGELGFDSWWENCGGFWGSMPIMPPLPPPPLIFVLWGAPSESASREKRPLFFRECPGQRFPPANCPTQGESAEPEWIVGFFAPSLFGDF